MVYLFYMFEAFTDMKMRIEPYIRLEIRVFLRSLLYFSMVLEIYMVANIISLHKDCVESKFIVYE